MSSPSRRPAALKISCPFTVRTPTAQKAKISTKYATGAHWVLRSPKRKPAGGAHLSKNFLLLPRKPPSTSRPQVWVRVAESNPVLELPPGCGDPAADAWHRPTPSPRSPTFSGRRASRRPTPRRWSRGRAYGGLCLQGTFLLFSEPCLCLAVKSGSSFTWVAEDVPDNDNIHLRALLEEEFRAISILAEARTRVSRSALCKPLLGGCHVHALAVPGLRAPHLHGHQLLLLLLQNLAALPVISLGRAPQRILERRLSSLRGWFGVSRLHPQGTSGAGTRFGRMLIFPGSCFSISTALVRTFPIPIFFEDRSQGSRVTPAFLLFENTTLLKDLQIRLKVSKCLLFSAVSIQVFGSAPQGECLNVAPLCKFNSVGEKTFGKILPLALSYWISHLNKYLISSFEDYQQKEVLLISTLGPKTQMGTSGEPGRTAKLSLHKVELGDTIKRKAEEVGCGNCTETAIFQKELRVEAKE
eukprot:bmy_08735T0